MNPAPDHHCPKCDFNFNFWELTGDFTKKELEEYYIKYRSKYKPDKVKYLIINESPTDIYESVAGYMKAPACRKCKEKEIRISRTSRNGSVLIITDSEKQETNINSQLIKAIARSHYWNNLLLSGEVNFSVDIQKMEKLKTRTYVKNVLKLRFLAPQIIEPILNGTQPGELTVEKLFKIQTLDWDEQKKLLLFGKTPRKIQTEKFG